MRSFDELLLESGVISAPQLAVAKRDAVIRQKGLAQTLIDLGFISDRRFAEWIAGVANAPVVDPLPADQVVASRMPVEVARTYEIVPLAIDGNTITIATVNPFDDAALAAVKAATGMNVKPVVALYGQLLGLLSRYYSQDEGAQTVNPNSTLAIEVPFEFGTETLISSHRQPLVLDEAPTAQSQTQLDRIEAQLGEILRAVGDLQRRVDALDGALARVLTRG